MPDETPSSEVSFETALTRLDQIVQEMEDSTLPLQRMLVLFEEGTLLGRRCQELLDLAELRILQVVQGADGNVQVRTFDGGAQANGADPAF
ncbi:MAG: exodeoxyribonuclease VII small subunit [Chloroflexota bacterium]